MNEEKMCGQVERNSEVVEHANFLDAEISMLLNEVEELTTRLSSVLRSEPPCDPEKEKETIELVPLAMTLLNYNRRVKDIRVMVDGILERLEL